MATPPKIDSSSSEEGRRHRSRLLPILLAFILSLAVLPAPMRVIAQEAGEAQEVMRVRYLAERGSTPYKRVQWAILKLALQKSGRPFDLDVSRLPTGPDRTATNLTIYGDEGNVIWGAPRPEREEETLVVHLPVLRGLLQYWLVWAREDQLPRFADIRTAEDLGQFSVIQGLKWSSTPAFRKIGIEPVEADFINLPDMLSHGRADLLPYPAIGSMGISEDAVKELGLAPLPNVMLIWPSDHFFMVDRNNQALHDALYEGLLRAFDDGSYAELMRSHPESRDAFSNIDLGEMNLIQLENPYMTPEAQAAIDAYAVSPAEIFGGDPAQ